MNGKCQPMNINRKCSQYLGIVIAERVLSKIFDGITRMPNNNKGYDFICKKKHKIDVKSSRPRYRNDRKNHTWQFEIQMNTIPNDFLCIAFDDKLNPMHVWLIPGHIVNTKVHMYITNTPKTLEKWSQYERPLDKVIKCCNLMKAEA